MKQFKKMLLSVLILALAMFHNSYAQCSGKKVYIELPDNWGSNIYIYWDGAFVRLNTTQESNYRVFTFSGLPNDNASNASQAKIIFSNKNTYVDQTGIMSLTRTNNTTGTINNRQDLPVSSSGFSCNNFGATTYISLVPNSTTQVTISSEPPNTRYFYFLPPNDPDWILNTPILWDGSNTTRMEVDPKRCGWYRIVYFTTAPSDNEAIIIQTLRDKAPNSTSKIGVKGMAEDPQDWIDGTPTPIKLKSQFDQFLGEGKGGDLFFVADGAKMGWSATDPMIDERNRCAYSFATIIYDTDRSKNPSFTTGDDDIGCGGDQWSYWTSGIIRGMVKKDLNPTTRKIECDNCAKGGTVASSQGYFVKEQDFKDAFDPTSSTNEVICYDMPFARTSDGLWEFDSDKMLNNNNKMVGGFYPEILQNYEGSCIDCRKKWKAESYVNLTDSINPWCFERGFTTRSKTGQVMSSCGAAYGPGDFSHGGNPADTWGATPKGGAFWDEDWRYSQINMWGGTNTGKNATANQLFCFESHAEFTYEPGQEFFFRGDDDIWVYMNNQLVVDLGGAKLAAPGYVNLKDQASKLGLTEGEKYPIDIFFCDRRTGMSNVRIKTNMYFAQETGLSLETKNGAVKGNVCLKSSGGGSCADVTGSGGEKLNCGAEIGASLKYYLTNRARTAGEDLVGIFLPGNKGIVLDRNNENCENTVDAQGDTLLLCYGGIKIYERLGKVQAVTDDITGLAGTWQVWVTHTDDPHPVLKISEFAKSVKVQVVWGEIRTEDGKLMANLNPTNSACVAAGETVKIGFAAAEQTGDNKFAVVMDPRNGSPGTQFSIAPTSFNDSGVERSQLVLCKDEACSEALEGSKFIIPNLGQDSEGLLALYAKGNFEAAGDAEYVIKVQGSSTEFKIAVYQPRGLFLKLAETGGKEVCLREGITDNTCAAPTASAEPICGAELASSISYSFVVPNMGSINLGSEASGCVWDTPTQGVCYGGIELNNGVVSIYEDAIPDYIKTLGFEIHASVLGYEPLNVSNTKPIDPPSSIAKIPSMPRSQEPAYYNLKGEPLGDQKPKKAGVYILRQNGVNRVEVVR
jgi:fibro-slime domain-containing protein